MDLLKFVVLDDTNHVIGAGEYTVCGIVIPQGETWSTDEPKKLCPDCKARAKDTDEYGVVRNPAPTPEVTSAGTKEAADKPAAKTATKDSDLSVTIPAVTLPVKEAKASGGDKA